MKFYDELSKVYDIIFKKDESTVNFLIDRLESHSRVLDLACGTGTYAIELAKEGCKIIGVDLDKEMINLAKLKSKDLNIDFTVGDMRKAKEIFNEERFNMIFCIGNSLVHLQDRNEVRAFIKDIYSMLEEKGIMVIQIINYDRIIKQEVKALPTIDRSNEGVKFVRNYKQEEDKEIIHFETELIIYKNSKEESYKNSVPLLPIQSNELISMIKEAGFKDITSRDGFSEKVFDENSYALVIRAQR